MGCQKSARPVSCSDGQGQPYGIMIICVSAPALSPFRPALRLAGSAQPIIGLKGCRVARAAARSRRAAPHSSAAPAGVGRPGGPRRADPAPASTAAEAPARHSRHHPLLAPPPGHPQVDLPAPDGTAAGHRRSRRTDRAARHREHPLGIQENPRRAAKTRPPGQRVHHSPGPQGLEDPRHRNGTATQPGGPSRTLRQRRCSPPTSFTWTAR